MDQVGDATSSTMDVYTQVELNYIHQEIQTNEIVQTLQQEIVNYYNDDFHKDLYLI